MTHFYSSARYRCPSDHPTREVGTDQRVAKGTQDWRAEETQWCVEGKKKNPWSLGALQILGWEGRRWHQY